MRLLLTRPGWQQNHVGGHLVSVLSTAETAQRVQSAHSGGDFRGLHGAWARIASSDVEITLTQDAIRSFPLFYVVDRRQDPPTITISDAVRPLLAETGLGEEDVPSVDEFSAFGFVTGANTLHREVRQVQAGESVTIRTDGQIDSSFYRSLESSGENVRGFAEADERFEGALDETIGGLLSRLDGRQVVIPLSGGLDSRLLAVEMHDRGYENVVNFTYGVGATAESNISRSVAHSLGQRWEFLPYEAERIRRLWADESTAQFIYTAYAGASLPHIQDWLAVHDMRERGLIEPDAVFLAGHTVVGNMHDADVIDQPGDVSEDTIMQIILSKNARMQPGSYRAATSNDSIRSKLRTMLARISYDGSSAARQQAIEYWNFLERQTKYINNSMRGYEHFGYSWALPMLEAPVLDTWATFNTNLTRDRDWYTAFVNRRYSSVTGAPLSTFEPTSLNQSTRARMKKALRAIGALKLAERAASARTSSTHPMAFQGFLGPVSNREMEWRVLRGGSEFGVFADLLINDRWNPHTDLFRREA